MDPRRQRSVAAALVAVAVTSIALYWLSAATDPLSVGTAMRSAAAWLTAGSTYTSLDLAWLGIRAILGVYITVVFLVLTLEVLGTRAADQPEER